MPTFPKLAAAALAAAGFFAACAYAAGTKPDKTQGLDPTVLQQFEIGAQVPQAKGYELRARRIIVAPGGQVTEHSHADRPGVVYVLEGTLTEHRGLAARVVNAGDTWAEDAGTVHWFENISAKPSVILAVDVVVAAAKK